MSFAMKNTVTKKLRPNHKTKVRDTLILAEHYKAEALHMEAALAALLKEEYGADVVNESWELDTEKGVLRKFERVEVPDPCSDM